MLTELGNELQKSRRRRGASLQAIALPADISGAYLHKLEQGKIDTPSPRVLRRLASELDIPYLRLMELAGYLDKSQVDAIRNHSHPLTDQELTSSEWQAVSAFIKVLVSQRDK